MLHAFRGPWPAPYDHFDAGTIHAAWLEIQARLYRDGYDVDFNDLGHYEKLPDAPEYQRPYYSYFQNYNCAGLSTSVQHFDANTCHLNNIIRRYRYGACGYCWWKVLHHDADFIKEFNGELCKMHQLLWPVKPNYDQLYWAAQESYDGGQIEGKSFEDWFAAQPILNIPSDHFEYVCAAVTNKDRVEVFNYYRTEYQGYPEEFPNNADYPGAKILLSKVDWDPSRVCEYQMGNLDEGYGVWSPPMVLDNGKFYVNAEYWELWETGADPEEWQLLAYSRTYGVNTDEAYETDEIFAVVSDAVNGEGWLDVSYNGSVPVRYPVSKYVARIPNFAGGDEAGAGEYELTYVPPGNDSSVVLSHAPIICKDGGCFFDYHVYLSAPDKSGRTSDGPDVGRSEDTEKADFRPPVATTGASPSAGDYLPPIAGDRPSPVALTPEGGGADVPGADFPPHNDPVLTSPTNSGGDWLSPGAAAAPFERRGPLAAAASASPLACSPNPVTATATISFQLETPSRVYLAVYDLSGRRVATLAEGSYGAGDHAAYWRADVPTGIYIYRLQAGDKIAVKKVVVAK